MGYKMPAMGLLTGVLVAIGAVQSYYLREILAVLLFFSIAFSVVAVVILILLLLDRALNCALVWTGPYATHGALCLHRGWMQAEQFSGRHLHGSEQGLRR